MSLPVVLDWSALDALVRNGAASIAVSELVDEVGEGNDPIGVIIAGPTYETVRDRLVDDGDEPGALVLAALLEQKHVQVVTLLPEQEQWAAVLVNAIGAAPASAAAYVLTLDVRGMLATYEAEAALQALSGRRINDLAQTGDEPAW